MNRTLIGLAKKIADAAGVSAATTALRHAKHIEERARHIEAEAGRLVAELRACIEPNPIREVLDARELLAAHRAEREPLPAVVRGQSREHSGRRHAGTILGPDRPSRKAGLTPRWAARAGQ